MKTSRPPSTRGFTLIEMIGVLAIMSIMAAVLVPSVLKSVERAAIKAEIQNVENLGEAVRLYLKTNRTLPTTVTPPAAINWTTQLADFANLSPSEIAVTRWGPSRTYVTDPTTVPATRAMIISSMRTGLAVPTAANLNSSTRFKDVWDTADGTIPSGASAGLWTAWSAATAPFLIVQRINLLPIYNSELQTFTVSLNNLHQTQPVRYLHTPFGASPGTPVSLPAKGTITIPNVRPKDRIDLYSDAAGTILNYSQVFNASATQPVSFRFDATLGQWMTP